MLPPLRPPLPPLTPKPQWDMQKLGYDKMQLTVNATLTRAQAFRLIGQLERLASTL